MKRYLAAFLTIIIVMIALDFVWLGVVAQPMYQQGIGHLMATQPNLLFAGLFYLVYVIGLIFFTIKPYASRKGVYKTALSSAFFGFFVYASYDLTNLALLKHWPVNLAIIDVAWGVFISGFSATLGKYVLDKLTVTRYF